MASRADDWMTQAGRDLRVAELALGGGIFETACFMAQQCAEKSVKALAQSRGGEARGHVVRDLLRKVHGGDIPRDIADATQALDRFYIPARYPNGWSEGAPADHYDVDDAEAAIEHARRVMAFCQSHMA